MNFSAKLRRQISGLSLCLMMGLLLAACGGESPIAAVTPLAMESAEFSAEATVVIVGDPSPSDAVSTVVALPAADESGNAPTVTPTFTPTPLPPEGATSSDATPAVETYSNFSGLAGEPTLAPIPVMEQVPRGLALNQAREQDRAWEPDPSVSISFEGEEPVVLKFSEFFVDFDPWSNQAPVLSDKLLALDGKTVVMEGYMAPPLQLGLDWFMMTRMPLGACPFHSSTATWTPDILLVYVDGVEIPFSWKPLRIEGELHVGGTVDPVTGMASLVRLYAADTDIREITRSSQ